MGSQKHEFEALDRGDGLKLAFHRVAGAGPTIVFLCGFHSEMTGAKGTALTEWAGANGRSYLRLDYSGHGRSDGRFEDGVIGRWRDDALTVIDAASSGPLVLIGSSMGGWMALLTALARPERIAGLVLIAPAPDFTERLIWRGIGAEAQHEIMERGFWMRPSAYEAPYPITRALIEEGRNHLLLDNPISVRAPVRILHGQQDPDVPWRQSLDLIEQLESTDVQLTLVKDGDHRLSRPQDIALLFNTIERLA